MNNFQPVEMKTILTHLSSYTNDDNCVAFLLGGIGTGNVSVSSNGALKDWELFNKPGKGNRLPYQMFCLHTEMNGIRDTRVLEARMQPPFMAPRGEHPLTSGLPRMRKTQMRAEYPFCMVEFFDEKTPVDVSMECYTPFIPLNSNDSGIPGAIIRYRIKNRQTVPVYVSIAAVLPNITSPRGREEDSGTLINDGETSNEMRASEKLNGIFMTSVNYPEDHPLNGSFALCTTNSDFTCLPVLYKGNRRDCQHVFWDDFSQTGALHEKAYDENLNSGRVPKYMNINIGALAPNHTLLPGEETVFEFILTWFIPNRLRSWEQDLPSRGQDMQIETVKNFYATQFDNAWSVAEYLAKEMPRLEKDTLAFHRALFESTYPKYVLDALAANITVLRSPTCFRIEDGTFLAWEGCNNLRGSCLGSCTHVWNYAQTAAFLFPDLEVSARYNEFELETEADGKMNFRATKALNQPSCNLPAASDGQCGTIVRLLREWRMTGDNHMIDDLGPKALESLEYCIRTWDPDRDGVAQGEQHNTYDIEFYGVNPLGATMYLAALHAGAQIAGYLKKKDKAAEYETMYTEGSRKLDKLLWNGEYYSQKISAEEMRHNKYQFGDGCLSDQLMGQYMAFLTGMGYIMPEENVKKALESILQYNYKENLEDFANPFRVYALNNEAGLLLCTWPYGGRPQFPFYFCDEIWTGIEYQVAACLIWSGRAEEGLKIVRNLRKRYDGKKRNPFDETECGHHYVRSMASWSLLLALSGYQVDLRKNEDSISPVINKEKFQTFYSTGKEWGIYSQNIDKNGKCHKQKEVLYKAE